MTISLVVAASENNAIGKNNQLLWHLPNDLKFFKNTTWGFPVIMGRKTFEDLGKPLAGRQNIVITRQKNFKADGAVIVNNLDDALFVSKEADTKEVFEGEMCGMSLKTTSRVDLQEGDRIELFTRETVARTL